MASSDGVESLVSNPKRVSERRRQIINAAVKLFSKQGYFGTSVQQIAHEAGVSTGLIYQYFGDKEDILFLTLKLVLETYEKDIPPQLEGLDHPLQKICAALKAYCGVVDKLREATVLAYRSTRSLSAERRFEIERAETRTNQIFENILEECRQQELMNVPDLQLLSYQYVHFAHAWALKHWAFGHRLDLDGYIGKGNKLLIEPHLTQKGRQHWDAREPN